MVVLGCVLGLLVAAFVARAVFGGSSGSKSASSSTTAPTSPAERPNPFEPVPGTATTIAPSPPTFPVYGSKNPFEPVIQIDTTPTSTTPTSSGGGGTTTTTPGTSGSTTTTTIEPSNNPVQSQTVTLIDVFRNSNGVVQARVQVGSTVFTVGEGDTFASGSYRVVSLDSPCGQFLFGDSPFQLCVGEQTLK
ncbi:MAG TPA: hypothetical protein VGO03_07460 [Acidimicrobiia bacterium]